MVKISQASCAISQFPPTQFHQRILDRVSQLFLNSPYAYLHHLSLEFIDNALVIQGKVPTFYLRQVALTLAQKTEGVDQIVDHITVS